jgi:hypothetical protein
MIVFYKEEMAILYYPFKSVLVDKQANDDIVHLHGFREADKLTNQACE